MISVRGLTAGYGSTIILRDVSFDVFAGEILVILGGSGCGKSTLLKHMIGLHRPMSGTVRIEGVNLHEASPAQRLRTLRSFGVSYQTGALFGSLTTLENVRLPLEECTDLPKRLQESVARQKLAQVRLTGFEDLAPAELSGGMIKRAAIARAMALDPKILFLDEPSAGLDPVTSAEIDVLIKTLSRQLGVTSVVVTHEMDSAFTIADRMAMLDKGRMILVESRDRFEAIRDGDEPEDESMAIVRQFLRGSPDGPITVRRQSTSYAEDLLGAARSAQSRPSLFPTRWKK